MAKNKEKETVEKDPVPQEETVPETEQPADPAPEAEAAPADDFAAKLEALQKQNADLSDKLLRQMAEFDNYRKRTTREKEEIGVVAKSKALTEMLPVVDNFERALKSMSTAKDVAALKEGVDLIYANFKSFLTQNGVKEIETENADFDTDIHEAVTTIPAPTPELKGKVLDCIEKGYYLNDKVMRFAKVVVGE